MYIPIIPISTYLKVDEQDPEMTEYEDKPFSELCRENTSRLKERTSRELCETFSAAVNSINMRLANDFRQSKG